MKIYEIKLKDWDYDEYDGWIVVAESKEDAIKLCELRPGSRPENLKSWQGDNMYQDNIDYIREIGKANNTEARGIVLSSYNAG